MIIKYGGSYINIGGINIATKIGNSYDRIHNCM
jgi:hypothetical protein